MKPFAFKASKILISAVVAICVVALAACAPQSASEKAATTDPANVTWSVDTDCAVCHLAEKQSSSDAACLASLHASSTCETCHPVDDALEKAHDGVVGTDKMPKRLKKTDVKAESCQSCHGDYADLAKKTADYDGLVDDKGTVVNPHDLPDTADHKSIECTNCHEMHKADSNADENAMSTCMGCHHEGVFECGTCHN